MRKGTLNASQLNYTFNVDVIQRLVISCML